MADYLPFSDAIETLEFGKIRRHIAGLALSGYGAERTEALEPSSIFAEVRDELDRVREMIGLVESEDLPPIEYVPDIRPALHRSAIAASVIGSQEFRDIFQALVVMRKLRQFFSKREQRAPLLAALISGMFEDKVLEYHIDRVVTDEGEVRDSASKELRAIRKEIIEKTSQLRRRMESILKRVSQDQVVQEELITLRDGRMVLPVKTEFKRMVQGFIHSTSATGQTVYIEPTETLDLNNEIRDLQFEEQREVTRILSELTDRLRSSQSGLVESLRLFADLDSLYARARYASAVRGGCPEVALDREMEVQHGRHPILLLHKKFENVVPLNLAITGETSTVVITGPNAGGKSVAMKTVGLLVLLVQSGFPAPCADSSRFPVYDDVLVDIGDEQSVENDLSTFSSHVRRLATIVERVSAKSLVLIDEIGTGTDPAEGSALAAAILEHLTSRRAHVIATTHHGMLKAMAHEHPHMTNAAMEFDLASLQPTYRYRAGLPGSSYAFEITRRHGLRSEIIERASAMAGTRSNALEQLLTEVERTSQEMEKRLRNAEASEQKHKALAEEYTAKLAGVKKEIKEAKKQALEEADRLLHEANAAVENAVREIREAQASKDSIKKAQDTLAQRKQVVAEQLHEQREPGDELPTAAGAALDGPISIGDTVALSSSPGSTGTVLEIGTGNFAVVAFGSMKMKVERSSLIRIAKKQQPGPAALQFAEAPKTNEIDLRGMYGDDAVKELDAFIYQAYMAGLKRIDVIHGKGTGALRKRIHTFLKDNPMVVEYKLAEWNEGGAGMTVVILKG